LLDPLIIRIVALGFAVLFLLAALHKLSNRMEFLQVLGGYKILPTILLRPATLVIPNVEIVIAMGWLAIGVLGFQLRAVPAISAGLLVIYGSAIAINLIKGRTDIDCGCSFTSSKTTKQKTSQQISNALVWRNGILALLCVFAMAPISPRIIGSIDYLALIAATLVSTLVYAAMNQLIANSHSMKPWLKKQEV
jgi:hypothetical protein